MSFTYSGDPAHSVEDAVRFMLGDTEAPGLFTDEEIAWALTQDSNVRQAAAICAEAAVAKYARQPTSKTLGETSITYGNLTQKFRDLAASLREQARRDYVALPWSPSTETGNERTPIAYPLTVVPEESSGAGTT